MVAITILITTLLAGIPLIRITEKDVQTQLTREIIHLGILKFDGETAYVKLQTHWQKIDRTDLLKVIRNLIDPEDRYEIGSKIIAEVAKRLAEDISIQFSIEAARKQQEYLINFLNGVYNTKTGEYIRDRSKFIFDYVINANYIEGCSERDCPVFIKFIETSAGAENKKCILIAIGYGISSLTIVKKAIFLLGETDGGKSTILDFISSGLSPELVSHLSFQQLGDRHFITQLLGKKINISYDNSAQPLSNEHIFKSIVACERIQGRALRENPISFIAATKLFFASNRPFVFRNPDMALYRRMIPIPFEYSIPPEKQDKQLLDKLIQERDVVFSLAAKSLKDFVNNGYDFHLSAKGQAYLNSRIAALHSVEDFLKDRVTVDEKGSVATAILYDAYKLWVNENALDADDKSEFKEKVLAYKPTIDYKKVGPKNKRAWGFKGLRFKTADELNAPDDNTEERK